MHKYKVMGNSYLTENNTIAMPYVIETTNKTLTEIIKKYEKQDYWYLPELRCKCCGA